MGRITQRRPNRCVSRTIRRPLWVDQLRAAPPLPSPLFLWVLHCRPLRLLAPVGNLSAPAQQQQRQQRRLDQVQT